MTHQRLFDCQTFLPASLPASLLPPSCLPLFLGLRISLIPHSLLPSMASCFLAGSLGNCRVTSWRRDSLPPGHPLSALQGWTGCPLPPTPPPRAAQVFGETWPVLRPPSSGGSQGQASQLDGVGFWRDPAERYRAAEPVEGAGGLGVSTKGSRACQGSLAKSKVNSKGGLQGKTWIPGAPTCCLWAGRPPSVPGSSLDLGTCRPF